MNTQLLQQLTFAGGTVHLPAGEVRLEPTTIPYNPDRLADVNLRYPTVIEGDPDGSTVIRMVGGEGQGARSLFAALAGRFVLRNVKLDSTDRGNLSEQCHLVTVGETTTAGVTIGASALFENVTFVHPRKPGSGTGGDGIKISGGQDVKIRQCGFSNCDRAAISMHHGGDLTIEDVDIVGTGDADIDVEPPADVRVRRIRISNVRIIRPEVVGEPAKDAVQLTRCDDVRVSDLTVLGGNLLTISAADVELHRVALGSAGTATFRRSRDVLANGLSADLIKVSGDRVASSKTVTLWGAHAREAIVETAERVFFIKPDIDLLTWRDELGPTTGGVAGGRVGQTLKAIRGPGIPWLLE